MYNCFIFLRYKQRENRCLMSMVLNKLPKNDTERFPSGGVKTRLINAGSPSENNIV